MNNINILWVDDEIDLLKPHILFLEQKNYKVTTCQSGTEALEIIDDTNFDIVFLDENMPGMNGLETLTAIKQIKSNFGWLAIDKTLAIFHSLIVGAMVAKYLEPSKFGILANAMAIGAIMRPIVSMGSDQVVTRRFIHEDKRAGLYWTMFCARIALGLAACIAVFLCLYSGLVKLSDQTEAWVIIITTFLQHSIINNIYIIMYYFSRSAYPFFILCQHLHRILSISNSDLYR